MLGNVAVSKRSFTLSQRHAVFTVHGERCYVCRKPLTFKTFDIDHIIPESLADFPEELARVLAELGRAADFNIHSYENWMPICSPCNRLKSDTIWEASPLVQLLLQLAKDRASRAHALATEIVSNRDIERALGVLERAHENGLLSPEQIADIIPLVAYQREVREPELRDTPVRVTPKFEVGPYVVLNTSSWRTIVRGPYGVGGGPTNASSGMRCGVCGNQFFNGALCVVCGDRDDGS